MQYGPNDSSIDWNSGSVVYWTIGENANGKAYTDFRIKTNEFGGQNMALGAGHLAGMGTTAGPLGTWSLSFTDNTNCSIKAPDGSVTNFTLWAEAAAIFQDPLYAYFGIQPNGTNNTDYSRLGQAATFRRIRIDESAGPINDDFSTGALDTGTWIKCAANNTGIMVTPVDSAFWLSWTTPDPGFTNIWVSSDVSLPRNDQWIELTGVPQASWLNILDRRTALVPWSALNTALGGSETNQAFFGLGKVVGP